MTDAQELMFYLLHQLGEGISSKGMILIGIAILVSLWALIWPTKQDGGRRAGTRGYGFELGRDGLLVLFGDRLIRFEHRWSNPVFRPGWRIMLVKANHGPPPNCVWMIDILGFEIGYAPNGRWKQDIGDGYKVIKYFGNTEPLDVKLTVYGSKNNPFSLVVKAIVSVTLEKWYRDNEHVDVMMVSLALVGENSFVCRDTRYRLPINVIGLDWVLPDTGVKLQDMTDEQLLSTIADTKRISMRIDPEIYRGDGAAVYDGVGYRILGFARPKGEKLDEPV